MHFLNLSQFFNFPQFFNEMKNNEEESFLSSVKCRIRTVYYGLVLLCFSKENLATEVALTHGGGEEEGGGQLSEPLQTNKAPGN